MNLINPDLQFTTETKKKKQTIALYKHRIYNEFNTKNKLTLHDLFQPFRVLWPSTLTLPLPSPSSCQVGPLPLGRAQLSQEEGEVSGRERGGGRGQGKGWDGG